MFWSRKGKAPRIGRVLNPDKKSNENTQEMGTTMVARVWKRGKKESQFWIKEARHCK